MAFFFFALPPFALCPSPLSLFNFSCSAPPIATDCANAKSANNANKNDEHTAESVACKPGASRANPVHPVQTRCKPGASRANPVHPGQTRCIPGIPRIQCIIHASAAHVELGMYVNTRR